MFELRRVSYPMRTPMITAHGSTDRRDALLLGVAADGQTGWTEYAPLPGFDMVEDLDVVEAELRAALDGGAVSDLAARLVDAARNDLTARLNGVPLAEHLAGADAASAVVVNATISAADPAEVALQARTAVDAGHRAITQRPDPRTKT